MRIYLLFIRGRLY